LDLIGGPKKEGGKSGERTENRPGELGFCAPCKKSYEKRIEKTQVLFLAWKRSFDKTVPTIWGMSWGWSPGKPKERAR